MGKYHFYIHVFIRKWDLCAMQWSCSLHFILEILSPQCHSGVAGDGQSNKFAL